MPKKKKISLLTKFLSQRHYLAEVSVDCKKNVKFHYKLGFFDHYVAQIIRTGNGITLLTNEMTITEDSFAIRGGKTVKTPFSAKKKLCTFHLS